MFSTLPSCRLSGSAEGIRKKKNTHKLFAHIERHKSVMLKSQIICHFELKISFKGLSRVIFMLNLYILIPTIIIRTTTSAAFYSSRTMPGFFRCIAATCVYYVCCAVSIFYYEAVSIWLMLCKVFKIKLSEIKEKLEKQKTRDNDKI